MKQVFVIPQLAKHAHAECFISQLESRATSSPSTDLGLDCFTTDHKSVGEGETLKKVLIYLDQIISLLVECKSRSM